MREMSEMIRSSAEEYASHAAGKKLLDVISAEFAPVMAHPNGDMDAFIDGKRVKFRIVSIEDACGYCGGPGIVGKGPDDYRSCPVCRTQTNSPGHP